MRKELVLRRTDTGQYLSPYWYDIEARWTTNINDALAFDDYQQIEDAYKDEAETGFQQNFDGIPSVEVVTLYVQS